MYIMGGLMWSKWVKKRIFSKKVPKNSVFEGHKSGSPDFGGA